jgi:cellulose synthase/poly-beta-1,6-N-acetylglucosamine synthase-like glycosyltransferase
LPPARTASIVVIALNEESAIGGLFDALEAQDYPHELVEILLIDGGSGDATKALMEQFSHQNEAGFAAIKVLDNPRRVQPAGWNVGIAASTGDVILMLAAHASVPPDFISCRIVGINAGEHIYGGPWTAVLQHPTAWREVLLMAEQSIFGSGGSAARRNTSPSYVNSAAHAAYRREVFEQVGLYDERLVRTEDNELSWRIRAAGFRFLSDPAVTSYHFARDSFRAMMRQKYANGFWVGRTLLIVPACISKMLGVPALFVLAILLALLLGATVSWWPALALALLYGLPCIAASVFAFAQAPHKTAKALALPLVILSMHICYGTGTLVGLIAEAINPLRRRPRGAWEKTFRRS